MAKKNPPKSAGSKNSTTGQAYLPSFSGNVQILYSLDVANNDFLSIKEIRQYNNINSGYISRKPGEAGFDAYLKDPNVLDAFATSVGAKKDDIINQGTTAFLDASEAANRSSNSKYWTQVPVNPEQNILQSPISGISTNVPAPKAKEPEAETETILDVPIVGDGSGKEFIKSIGGDVDFINLKYPVDAIYGGFKNTEGDLSIQGGQDFIAIEQFIYRPPQDGLFKNLPDPKLERGESKGPLLDALRFGLGRNSNLREFLGIVRLPIPNNLSMSNGVDWGDSRANPVEAGAFFSANKLASDAINTGNVASLFTESFKGLGEFFKAIGDGDFGQGTQPGTLISAFLAQYGLGKLGINVDPAEFIARGTGNTINPNLELLFSGPKLRSFSFQFKFAPNSVVEADECRRILRFFKQGMAAKRSAERQQQLFLGSPNVFRLRYLTKNNDPIRSLPRYKICALTSTDVDYSPGPTYQSYDDPIAGSQTIMMVMTLNFTELTPIFESDYRTFDSASQQDLFATFGNADDLIGPMSKINDTDVGF